MTQPLFLQSCFGVVGRVDDSFPHSISSGREGWTRAGLDCSVTIYSLDVLHFLFGTSLLIHVQFYAARQASLSITNSWSSLKPMSIEAVMPSNHSILCRLLLLFPP